MNYPIKTGVILNSKFSTMSGLPVKDVRFNIVLNVWFGIVSGVSHVWDRDGRCIDRTHPELDWFNSYLRKPINKTGVNNTNGSRIEL